MPGRQGLWGREPRGGARSAPGRPGARWLRRAGDPLRVVPQANRELGGHGPPDPAERGGPEPQLRAAGSLQRSRDLRPPALSGDAYGRDLLLLYFQGLPQATGRRHVPRERGPGDSQRRPARPPQPTAQPPGRPPPAEPQPSPFPTLLI